MEKIEIKENCNTLPVINALIPVFDYMDEKGMYTIDLVTRCGCVYEWTREDLMDIVHFLEDLPGSHFVKG